MLPHGFSKWTAWAGTRVVFHAWNSVEPATLGSDPPPTPLRLRLRKLLAVLLMVERRGPSRLTHIRISLQVPVIKMV